jgi:hypothetical protein
MSDHTVDPENQPDLFLPDLFVAESARSTLGQLLEDARLYKQSKDYKDLLDFVVRLRDFAPFNAMLLQIQKPDLKYAASIRDWAVKFCRHPKPGARPLLILRPFGPVALVYDEVDTEGAPLPRDVRSFVATSAVDDLRLEAFARLIEKKQITCRWVDAGDAKAGLIQVTQRPTDGEGPTYYQMHINQNHAPPVQFATLAHELGHLLLGHLGADKELRILERRGLTRQQQELEAESVAYLVCERNGVRSRSHPYLSHFVDSGTTLDQIDVYGVMRAAGRIESLLGLEHREP